MSQNQKPKKTTAKELIPNFITANYQGKHFSASSIIADCSKISVNAGSVKNILNELCKIGFIRVVARGNKLEAIFQIDDGSEIKREPDDQVLLTEFAGSIQAALLAWRTVLPQFARHV